MQPRETNAQKLDSIFTACRKGNMDRVSKYVEDGGCLTEGDSEKMTMLHHAAAGGQVDVLKCIAAKAETTGVNLPIDAGDSGGWTPLHYAADRGLPEVVAWLVEEGANLNAKDEMKRSPLHLAANAGRTDAVKTLTAAGASRALKTVVGWTALRYAEENNFPDIVALLKESP